MTRTVVITGAAGNLGGKLRAHLEALGGYELRLLDIHPRADATIQAADLSRLDPAWTARFAGAEAVVHLAADVRNQAPWADLIGSNVDAVANVYAAAAEHGVQRVVFASSVWAMRGLQEGQGSLTTDLADAGGNAYGAAKIFGERLGLAYWRSHGITSVSLRLGGCHPGANLAGPRHDNWEDQCWLSNRDACRGMELAITAPVEGAVVVNLVSDNLDSRWSLAEGRASIGYIPQDRGSLAPTKPEAAGRWTVGRVVAALRRRLAKFTGGGARHEPRRT